VCVIHKFLRVSTDGRSVSFHFDVISCELARRGVRRGAAAVTAAAPAYGRGNAVGLTSVEGSHLSAIQKSVNRIDLYRVQRVIT